MSYYGYGMMNYSYLWIMLPILVITLLVQLNVKHSFSKYSKIKVSNGMTGAQTARMILDANGLQNINVVQIKGDLTDNFNHSTNTVSLSESVYNSATPAAVGVAAHECGHACQYAQKYGPIKFRNAICSVTNIGSNIGWLLVILGIIFSFEPLAWVGVILFSTVVVFQLATLPVEFNASGRAIKILESYGSFSEEDISAARKVLTAAALTYVAALAAAVAQLLYLISRITGNRR